MLQGAARTRLPQVSKLQRASLKKPVKAAEQAWLGRQSPAQFRQVEVSSKCDTAAGPVSCIAVPGVSDYCKSEPALGCMIKFRVRASHWNRFTRSSGRAGSEFHVDPI